MQAKMIKSVKIKRKIKCNAIGRVSFRVNRLNLQNCVLYVKIKCVDNLRKKKKTIIFAKDT